MEGGLKMNGFMVALAPKEPTENLLAEVYRWMAERGAFPEGKTFWFAWCEEEIRLPDSLDNAENAGDPRWDVVRIFSPLVELRRERRGSGYLTIVVTEDEKLIEALKGAPNKFAIQEKPKIFPLTETGKRLLAGQRLDIGSKTPEGVKPDTVRGVVAFPRELVYGVKASLDEALVAEVVLYYDKEARLQYVRYKYIDSRPVPKGAEELEGTDMEVKPYARRFPD